MTGALTSRVLIRFGTPFTLSILILSILMVCSPSPLNWDEGYYLSSALGYLRDGTLYVKMWNLPPGTSLINGGGQGYAFLIYLYLHKLFGLDVVVGRTFALLCGIASISACYLYVKRVFDRESAIVAALFYANSLIFLLFISARFDAPSILVSFMLLLLGENVKDKAPLFPHLLLGLLAVWALEFHLQISVFILCIWCGYLIRWLGYRSVEYFKKFAALSTGLTISSALFIILHLEHYKALRAITEHCWMCDTNFFITEYLRLQGLFNRYSVEVLVPCAVVLFTCIEATLNKERNPEIYKKLKPNFYLPLIGYLFFILHFPPHREIFLWPLFAPIVGYSFKRIFSEPTIWLIKILTLVALVLVWTRAASVALDRIIPSEDVQRDLEIANCLKERYSKEAGILAPGPKYIHLPQFYNYQELGRGMKYVIPLTPSLKNQDELEAAYKIIASFDPSVIWIDKTDWAGSQAVADRYLEDKNELYELCCSNITYCKREAP